MKKGFWFKVITVLVMQAILLTQAECALAAIFASKDLCREAALKYQKITTKTISLIFGAAGFESGSKFDIDSLFCFLTGRQIKPVENLFSSKTHTISKQIYKVFAVLSGDSVFKDSRFAALSHITFVKIGRKMAGVCDPRAPPMANKTIFLNLKSRIA